MLPPFARWQTLNHTETLTVGSYDLNGQRIAGVDKAGRMSASVYDSLGRVVLSGPVSVPYTGVGTPVWLTNGTTAQVSTPVYDDAGQVTSSKDALGRVSSTTFDDLGRTKTSTDALNHTTTSVYDDAGRQKSVTDANQHTTTYDYDLAGRLTTTHYPDGVSTSTTGYDELGRRISQTDQAGHTTQYAYDTLGRLFTVTDPMLHVTTFGYDALGEKTSQQDANGHTTYFSYDNRGRLVSKTLPMGQSDSRTYDGLGRLLTLTDFIGKVTVFSYDLLTGRLVSRTAYANAAAYASNTPTGEGVSFTYNVLDGSRKTATRTMPGGTSITTTYAYYGYDASSNPTPDFRQGQLYTVTTQASGGPVRMISYNYDVLGNKISMTTPGGSTISYGYDVLSRLQTVTHPDSAVTMFGYDKVGNRQSVTRTNTAGAVFSTTGYIYDTLNRLTDIVNKNGSNGLVSSYHYGLRLDGKRYSVGESGPATSNATTNYTYDDQGKLTLEAGPYATIAYGYDNVGNRLTRTVTNAAAGNGTTLVNGATNTAYDVNDRIVGHTYDADGNETTFNGQAASYDFENHLITLGSVANYVYDADGNRVSVSNAGTTTSYVVDTSLPYASVVEEYTGTGTVPSARYDYGDDLVRMDRGPVGSQVASYYLFDGLGSTRQLVNTGGTVTDSYGYSAFGELASRTSTQTTPTVNPFLFNAQQFDQASGDYYLRARYYDQSNGRFISQDPYSGNDETPASLHRYLYAGTDPTDMVDPSGAAPIDGVRGKFLEANIYGQYISNHPSIGTQSNNSKQYYDANGWIPINVYYASGQNKNQNNKEPDIFDFTPGTFTFNEVKPFSFFSFADGRIRVGGILDGIEQILQYARAYSPANSYAPNGFKPNVIWEPSSQPIFCPVDGKNYVVLNMGGILFYISDEYRRVIETLAPLLPLFSNASTPAELEQAFEEAEPTLIRELQQVQFKATEQTAEKMIQRAYAAEQAEAVEEEADATLLTVL